MTLKEKVDKLLEMEKEMYDMYLEHGTLDEKELDEAITEIEALLNLMKMC